MSNPPERRPRQSWGHPVAKLVTHTLESRQLWYQYGWMDNEGRMYDLGEDPSKYGVASFSPLYALVDDEPPVIDV